MNKLSEVATEEEKEAAMQALKDHVASKIAAGQTAAATANGALAIQKGAAEKAAEAASEAVAQAAATEKEKEKMKTVSDSAIAKAQRAALVAKISLENADRVSQGKPPLEVPQELPLKH